ncbi:MAG: 30S ribosomal protein S16 [Anaerolineae bacterium]|jgi:small subunit ribosomal protein S16
MVKIRLRRVGARKQPSYRIVVADARFPRDGRFIEAIGFYNPRTEPETVRIEEKRALHWLSVGAQPTEAVARLLKNWGTLDRLERLHSGESLEDLVAEADEARQAQPIVSPKTTPVSAAQQTQEEQQEQEKEEEEEEEEEEKTSAEAEEEPSPEAPDQEEGEEEETEG